MCGIIGYIGKGEKTLSVLIRGLKNLEYRGYDSAGIAYFKDNNIKVIKEQGKIHLLEKKINLCDNTTCGIGHTRWATNGEPNVNNAHPHSCGKFSLVHNGIIENADILKKKLIKEGAKFLSSTDTEVLVVLLNNIYEKTFDIQEAIKELMTVVKGSYALAILCEDDIDHIYVAKYASPLIIGLGKGENYIASDIPAILENTKDFKLLEDNEYAVISKENIKIYTSFGTPIKRDNFIFDGNIEVAKKDGYDYFMLKEMMEQPDILYKLFNSYLDHKEEWREKLPNLSNYNKIDIVACGSAYHAGLIGKWYIENYLKIPTGVFLASEYRYQPLFVNDKTLVILVSQSGETADTLACLNMVKKEGLPTLAIVNVVASSIARRADYVLYTNAGYEIAVATTKAYTAQIASFLLLTFLYKETPFKIDDVKKLYEVNKKLLFNHDKNMITKIASAPNIFFLGRQIDYALAMESSLKLREISYLMSVTYAAGELKHGTISLIEKGTVVIIIITDEKISDKTISNAKEVKARGAYIILITSETIKDNFIFADKIITIPKVLSIFTPISTILPMQMLAYEVALIKGYDIDQPKNLAKSVTVE